MRFWDTSAIVPLLLVESSSASMKDLLARDESVVVWWGTPVESASALMRAVRSSMIEQQTYDDAVHALGFLRRHWNEIGAQDEVRRQALRIIRVHPLRAAEALQLGAAIVWMGRYEGREFVSLDDRLRAAARAEGFSVLP